MAVSPTDSSPDRRRQRSIAVVCLVLALTLTAPVLAAGGALGGAVDHGSAATVHGDSGDGTDDGNETENDTETIRIEDSLERADGRVEVVVRLEETAVPDEADDPEAHLEDHAEETQDPVVDYAEATPGITVETTFWLTNAVLLTVDTDRVDLESFGRFSAVEAIHENFELSVPERPSPSATDADTTSAQDDGAGDGDGSATNGDPPATTGLELLNAPAVWDAHDTRGEDVRVAVLDTGVDASHPDIELYTDDPSDPTYPGGWAEFDADGNRVEGSTPYDSGTHGTHVSGTIAGGAESGVRIGVAPDAELLHGLVLHETSGSFAQIIAGMEWALASEADVINLSLGAAGRHDQLLDPVRHARESGVVVVAAAGNEGLDTSNSPANVYDAIGVGAVDETGHVAPFSGGEPIERSEWQSPPRSWPSSYAVPDVVGPGVRVTSSVPGGGYEAVPGTSMATPHVAGVVALLSSIDPTATPAEIEDALYETAWKPDGAESADPDVRYGHGIVDAEAAADALVTEERRSVGTTDTNGTSGTLLALVPVLGGAALAVVVAAGWALVVAVGRERGGD